MLGAHRDRGNNFVRRMICARRRSTSRFSYCSSDVQSQARRILRKACEYGAQKLLDSVVKTMTPAQIEHAQRRAQHYREKYVAPFRKY